MEFFRTSDLMLQKCRKNVGLLVAQILSETFLVLSGNFGCERNIPSNQIFTPNVQFDHDHVLEEFKVEKMIPKVLKMVLVNQKITYLILYLQMKIKCTH